MQFFAVNLRLIFLLVGAGVTLLECATLDDGVVDIKCGSLEDNLARLSYFGESVQVSAFMADGRKCQFEQDIATATWTLTVALSGSDESRCVMDKISSRNIYSIDVISFRRSPDFESQDDEQFLMECNFEPYQEQEEMSLPLVDNAIQSQHVVETHEGQKSSSNYSVNVVRMEGSPLSSVEVGSLVRLKVAMSPSEKERGLGFMPLKCDVMTPDKLQRTAILVNGCGTGYPFNRKRGFQMGATFGMSPPFRMFRLNPKKGVAFSCSFVTCLGDCIGSSCVAEDSLQEVRSKREAILAPSNLRLAVSASTEPKQIMEEADDPELDSMTTEDLNAKLLRLLPVASSEKSKFSKLEALLLSSDERSDHTDRQAILLVGQIDVQCFTRTVKIAILGMSAFVLFVFVTVTLVLLMKLREIR